MHILYSFLFFSFLFLSFLLSFFLILNTYSFFLSFNATQSQCMNELWSVCKWYECHVNETWNECKWMYVKCGNITQNSILSNSCSILILRNFGMVSSISFMFMPNKQRKHFDYITPTPWPHPYYDGHQCNNTSSNSYKPQRHHIGII